MKITKSILKITGIIMIAVGAGLAIYGCWDDIAACLKKCREKCCKKCWD